MTDIDPRALDDLIARLRARAANPARRTDRHRPMAPTATFPGSTIRSIGLGDLFGLGGTLGQDLAQVVRANQEGRIDPDVTDRMAQLESLMTAPVEPDLPPPTPAEALERAEAELGVALPEVLRRVYTEVADGGFGPAGGLVPLASLVATYRDLRSWSPGPEGQVWPEGLLPIVDYDPGHLCVEAMSGRVIDWDPEELTEHSGERGWKRSFSEHAPSVEEWLGSWVEARHPDEVLAEQMEESTIRQARESRAMIARMTPEERAAMGLPEVGWERVVWGGIGLDDDE
jgi:hypothetical protein